MELEQMLEAAMQKVLSQQTQTSTPDVAELVKKAVDESKAAMLAEVEAMVAKAMPIDREGVGRVGTMDVTTLESDPVAFLTKKAATIKSEDEWTDDERAIIGAAWHAVITDGMRD
jgi:hypothetical protein